MNKKIFIILMVLICALSISAVSAADDTSDDELIKVAGSFSDLKDEIDNTADEGTVNLDKNYTYSDADGAGTIDINKDLTIDGKGHTIDASGKVSVFTVAEGKNVIIKNLTFINGKSTNGGAITNNGNLTLIDCNFINNTADAKGGAIYNTKNLTVNNCVFDGNDIAIRNLGNTAGHGGAAIYSLADTTTNIMNSEIKNSIKNFKADRTDVIMGAICTSDNLTIINSKFTNNYGRYGGAICVSTEGKKFTVIIKDSTFDSNYALYGGAIYGYGDFNVAMDISNCNFTNNGAIGKGDMSPNDNNGGSLCIFGNVTASISDCNFINNSAQYGGAMDLGENQGLTISGCNFTNNSAQYGGAVSISTGNAEGYYNNVTISDCSFTNNSADEYGGAIWNILNTTVSNSVFANNTATTGSDIASTNPASLGSITLNNVTSDGKGIYISSEKIPTNITDTELATEMELDVVEDVTAIDNVTISGNVAIVGTNYPKVNGTVTITIEGISNPITAEVVNGTFEANIANVPAGTYNATVVFTGKDYIGSSATTNKFTVSKVETTIAIDDLNIYIGEDAIIVGNVTGIPEDATVIITVNGEKYNTIVNGTKFLVTVENLTLGSYNITASYEGTIEYESASANATVTVSKYPTVTTIVNITEVLDAGDRLLINATVTSQDKPVNGTVELYINGKLVAEEEAVDGNVSFNVTPYAGEVNVMVKFAGDDKYDKSNATQDITVNGMDATLTVPDITLFFKNGTQLIINLTSNGNNISDETVIININGVDYTKTVVNGTTSLNINLAPGTYKATVSLFSEKYNFTSVNATVTVLPVIKGNDTVLYFKNGTQYVALFLDGEGNPLAGANIQFNINGVIYNRTTDANGTASLNINLAPGNYIITATNNDNGALHANNVTVLSTVIGENIVKYYKNETQYIVKVLDGKGNALANQIVEYNINGVFYNRTTDANGTAIFNINLPAGNSEPKEYIVTAWSNGCIISNTITVLPVLTAEDFTEPFEAGKKFTANIVDGEGKPLAGAKIQFNINGVLYDKISDDEGNAGLNINLGPGEYIITSLCIDNGAVISNKVTVTPKV